MTPVAKRLQALADRRGVSPGLIAKTPETYSRMLAKIGLDSQDLPSVVPDAEALDRQIWRNLQERIENFNLNVEIVNLCKNRRISCYKTNGKSNNMAQSYDQSNPRKGQAPMVSVQKSQLVALFVALGFKAAADWNNERFQKKIEGLDKSQDELDLDDLNKDQKKLLKQLLAASKDDEEVRIDDDDDDVDNRKGKKGGKSEEESGKGKKGKSSKDDDDDEEEEDDDEDDDSDEDESDDEEDEEDDEEDDEEPASKKGKKGKSSKSDDDDEDEDESEDEEDDEEEGNDEDSDSSDLAARLTALEKKIDRLLKLAEGNGPKSAKSSAKDDDSDEDESDDEEDEEDDDDEEEETPNRKGKKSGKSSGGGVAKVSEVLEYVSNMMAKATSEKTALKPADVLKKLVKKFDTRDEDWLKEKLAAILPGKLSKVFKLKKTKDGRYWTQKK